MFGVNDGELSISHANSEFKFSVSGSSNVESSDGAMSRTSAFRMSVAVACIVGMGIDLRSVAGIGSCSSLSR
jgi:hypothetical protein